MKYTISLGESLLDEVFLVNLAFNFFHQQTWQINSSENDEKRKRKDVLQDTLYSCIYSV